MHEKQPDTKPAAPQKQPESKPQSETKKSIRASDIWMQAIGSTVLISLAPFVILFAIPISDAQADAPLLKILLAFAAGGLLGDAFLHLIPHAGHAATSDAGHGHSHGGDSHEPNDISAGLWVLAGIFAFLLVETVVRVLRGDQGHGHSHGVAHEADTKNKKKDKDSDEEEVEEEAKAKRRRSQKPITQCRKSVSPVT